MKHPHTIQVAIENALKAVEQQFDVEVQLTPARNGAWVLSVKPHVEGGAEKAEFVHMATAYGRHFNLAPTDYRKPVTFMKRKYELVAIRPQSPKYPLIGEDILTKRRFKLPTHILHTSHIANRRQETA